MDVLRRFRLALVALGLVVILGVIGYVVIEGWSVFDALYMTVITLATIGYGEVGHLSHVGRLFTIVLIVTGLLVGAYTAGAFTELVIAERISEVLGHRRMERELKRLSGHCIICGWGRMGQEIVEQFRSKRVPFVVIETSAEKCRRLMDMGILYVQGDASDDATLRNAGVERARALVAVAPKDADNIFITLSARSLNKELFIVARSVYDQDIHKLSLAGADRVISPYVIGARRIASAVFHPSVVDFLDLEVQQEDAAWELQDLEVGPQSPFAGKSLRDSGIREQTGCTVLAVQPGGTRRFMSNPPPDLVLNPGDRLIILGTDPQLHQLAALCAAGLGR